MLKVKNCVQCQKELVCLCKFGFGFQIWIIQSILYYYGPVLSTFLGSITECRPAANRWDVKFFLLFVFKPIAPSHSLPLIHGKAGVSHLSLHNSTIYSSGRDGVYRQLRVHNNTLEVIDTKKVEQFVILTQLFMFFMSF